MMECAHRIAIVDDHPLLRMGLAAHLTEVGLAVELPELQTAPQIVEWIGCRSLACVVLDLGLPTEGGGLALIEPVVATGTPVVVLTGETEPALLAESIGRGAQIVLEKAEPLAEIVEAIRLVCTGARVKPNQRSVLRAESQRLQQERDEQRAPFMTLSPREKQVLAGLMGGHGAAALAERDFVSVQTVRTQIKSLLRKLGVRTQLEAVARAHASHWQHEQPNEHEVGRRPH